MVPISFDLISFRLFFFSLSPPLNLYCIIAIELSGTFRFQFVVVRTINEEVC